MPKLPLGRIIFICVVFSAPVVFILVPFASFLVISFAEVNGPNIVMTYTLSNYLRIFEDPTFTSVITNTVALSLGVAALCTLIGYPIAYLMALSHGKLRYFLLCIFGIPLIINYVIRIYALRNILGGNGLLNKALVGSGILDRPTDLFVFNLNSVFIVLTSILLPFAVFPIFIALERIPNSLLHAAADLGASRLQIFKDIVLPLSMPGAAVALSFTFILSIGDFVTPTMVGGPNGFTLGRVIYSQFGFAFNWPFGAALAVVLMIIVLLALSLTLFMTRKKVAL